MNRPMHPGLSLAGRSARERFSQRLLCAVGLLASLFATFLLLLVLVSCVLVFVSQKAHGGELPSAVTPTNIAEHFQQARSLKTETAGRVFKTKVEPHWYAESKRFWYRNDLSAGKKEFVKVDAERGVRQPAFDHVRLAEGLAKALGKPAEAERLPFGEIEFCDDEAGLLFECHGKRWRANLVTYDCAAIEGEKAPAKKEADETKNGGARSRADRPRRGATGNRSPNGQWNVAVENDNLVLRSTKDDSRTVLSEAGRAGKSFAGSPLHWSADSKYLVACRIEPGSENRVYLLESSAAGALKSKLVSHDYPQPGHRFASYELWTFDIEAKKASKVEAEPVDFHGPPEIRWLPDDRSFAYRKDDRGHQRVRMVRVDAATGQTRNLVDEKAETFIDGTRIYTHWFADGRELLWASERDGWRHLYLIDAESGAVKRQVTRGPWVVRDIQQVDEATRTVWFSASGRHGDQDPYFVHYYRTSLGPANDPSLGEAGSTLAGPAAEPIALTAGNGQHTVRFSPDRKYLIDTYARVDLPPVTELRRAEDGTLVCELEKADIAGLTATGWQPPEVFSAKGRDGTTDIWGHVFRPRKFDATKKYPVIESIYAGPHDSHVPKHFGPHLGLQELAELGFVVVQIDGMGTSNRSRAFHDVCWKNLGDGGFADRILWLKALAAKHPQVDLTRVGIFGTSAGGYDSTRALLAHPDFYRVAVSSCGNHDHRIDKQWWNEQWMGYPIGDHYREQSNITQAARLKGKLMLIVGELDRNVPPESTFQLANALIKAGKDFELVVVPGMGHSSGGSYGERKRRDFFVRHLHGVEPPAWGEK